MVQMGEIPSQNQKNRGDMISSAKFSSWKAISDFGPKKKGKKTEIIYTQLEFEILPYSESI